LQEQAKAEADKEIKISINMPTKIKEEIVREDGLTAADFVLDSKTDKYFEGIGRRKTAVARVRLCSKGDKGVFVNGKEYTKYFLHADTQEMASASLKELGCIGKFRFTVIVRGGGIHAQAEAVRHGTARALLLFNERMKKPLRKAGFLTRDPRMRERKKFGLRRARRRPQWAKR